MTSLRRPSQAIPRSQPNPALTARPPQPGDPVAKRDARKSKVGDKIKKRMSMRYAGPSDMLSVVPPLPGQTSSFLTSDPYQNVLSVDVPREMDDDDAYVLGMSQLGQHGSEAYPVSGMGDSRNDVQDEKIGRRGAADVTKEEEWDLEELGSEGFDLQGFLGRTLAGADEDEIQRFMAALQRSKQINAKELQRNVFKHYAEFVTMSKEIATLENDMLELKELLGQWKDLPQLMGMEDTLAPTLDKNGNMDRRRVQRNSVADLQQVYKSQITNLWSTVEGSQKYLPLVAGRHLVHETHNFVELNAATYKAKQSVSMFLLNDLLLIAGRRRTKTAPTGDDRDRQRDRGRTVAERCWVLADLVVVDVKDSGDLTNALKIRRGKEVCVYRTSKPEDKKALLAAFRQVSQELGEKKRKESEKEQQRRKSMWQGDHALNGPISPNPGLLSPSRLQSTLGLSVSDSKDLRWIDDFGDELTMAIAMRDWDAAVSLIEKAEESKKIAAPIPAAFDLLTSRLSHLRPTLISQILHDLSSTDVRKSATSRLVSLLSRLDEADLARDAFLKTRREVMHKRVRGIKCDGDTIIYISELAIVCFTILRHTSEWYMAAFKDNRMASGFVTWAKEQIETFCEMFRRQVYASNVKGDVVEECLRVTASHNRKLLRDVGLDFTYLLSTLLSPDANSSNHTLPMFNMSAVTPAGEYHTDPSPYAVFTNDTPTPNRDARPTHDDQDDFEPSPPPSGSTAPLTINPRSPRRPRGSESSALAPLRSPESPIPPPRSIRRGPMERSTSIDSPRLDEDSLR